MMRARGRLAIALASLALVLAAGASPWSDGSVLVRLDKEQSVALAADVVSEMHAVQELETAWLVRMPAEAVSRLDARRVGYRVLDFPAGRNVLFLVSSSAPEDVDALKRVGTVWPIDGATSLVATDDEDLRERVPAHLHLKHLPDRIDVVPTFRLAGPSVAVRRPAVAIHVVPASPIPEMVNAVSSQAIADTIKSLAGFQTRYASLPSCAAAGTWLLDAFHGFGLQAQRDEFAFRTYTTGNIVATLPGRTMPRRVVIVGAHYDSTSNEAARLAPGADDNASGTAAVLELARILSRYSFDYTIEFIAFSAEEWGLYGSTHYAETARAAGEEIVAVVNLDMIGYTDRLPEDLDLIVNARSEWLADTFSAAAALYAPMPTLKVVNASLNRSDHSPFWDQGYSALCGIEDYNTPNPNYHKTYDTFSTLNMDFETSTARAALATVALLAQPYAWPPPPANVTAQAHTIATVFMRAKSAYLAWTPAPGAAGYNVYRSTTSRGAYQRVNRTPVTTTSFADRLLSIGTYYYVVASVDGSGNEGNYSQEVIVQRDSQSR